MQSHVPHTVNQQSHHTNREDKEERVIRPIKFHLLIITLNGNDLGLPIKTADWLAGLKKKWIRLVVDSFNPSTRELEAGRSLSSKQTWFAE